jgi:hypothetical protein
MKTVIISNTIKKPAKSITFNVDTGFIIAFGFAIDPLSKSSKHSSRRYYLVLPFLILEMTIRKTYC